MDRPSKLEVEGKRSGRYRELLLDGKYMRLVL